MLDGYGMGIITRNGYPIQKCDCFAVCGNGGLSDVPTFGIRKECQALWDFLGGWTGANVPVLDRGILHTAPEKTTMGLALTEGMPGSWDAKKRPLCEEASLMHGIGQKHLQGCD
jgi:hypothetical protein